MVSGTGSIFRIDSAGQTENDAAAADEIIEFNAGAVKPDSTGRTVESSFRMKRDINFHPNPRRALDQLQDGLLGIMDVIVTGYFIDHDSTGGPIQFFNWSREPAMNNSLKWGRFGLRLDDFAGGVLNLTPSATTGYVLYEIEVMDVESPRDQVGFVAKFYRNGTI